MDGMDSDLTGRLMSDMDPRLLTFLRTKIGSFVKWDLIRFFNQNPHTTDTARNVARYVGRSADTLRTELAELAADGVLMGSQLGEMTVYSLAPDPEVRELVKQFVESSNDRQFRVKVIYHIIRGADR
jgi:hypothetical protein